LRAVFDQGRAEPVYVDGRRVVARAPTVAGCQSCSAVAPCARALQSPTFVPLAACLLKSARMLAHASFSVLTTVLSASLLALVGCQAPAASAPLAKPAPTATASGSGAAPAAAAGGALEVIKVGDVRVLNGGGLYVAVEKGYFRDQGLDVRLENLTGGADAVPFLATGELDLALGNVSVGLFNAFDRGADVKIIAPAGILPCRIAPCR
jgi:NMT1/THI5 like protein